MGNNNESKQKSSIQNKVRKPRRSVLENDDLKKGIISEINHIRKIHQVSELMPSNDIDSIAQSFSNKLSKKGGEFEFSNNTYKGEELGEISFYNELGEVNTEAVIETWYEYEKNFEYNVKNQEATPFAQLVWKSSKLIGIGLSKDSKGGTYIVANFYPAGNVTDKYDENVFKPTEDRKNKSKKNKEEFSNFELEALKLHNEYRNRHHSPPLTLNKELCIIAKNYSEQLIQSNNKKIEYSFGRFCGDWIIFSSDFSLYSVRSFRWIWQPLLESGILPRWD